MKSIVFSSDSRGRKLLFEGQAEKSRFSLRRDILRLLWLSVL